MSPPKPDFTLVIESDVGVSGLFVVRPLQETEEFFKLDGGRYFVEWNCGADLSVDTIFSKLQCDQTSRLVGFQSAS